MPPVTTYYYEMLDSASLRSSPCPDPAFRVVECEIKNWEYNRFLYEFVGRHWAWFDKNVWTPEQWRAYAEADDLRTWVGHLRGSPAGYVELQRQPDASVEISYFGLALPFIGQRLGGYLLTCAIENAWRWDAKRVWVHTCSLDHPNAMNNYQARGMVLYKTEVKEAGANWN
jgi:hypothetical protein